LAKEKRSAKYFVYIVKCSDGSFYTGYTNNLENRIKAHNSGRGAKCLRGKLPIKLVYSEKHKTLSSALKVEYRIKKMSHQEKAEKAKNI